MKVVETAGLRFGEGLPKLCVPLTAPGLRELEEEVRSAEELPADLYEWRIDCFSGLPHEVPEILRRLDRPLLCTVRTCGEGGRAALSPEEYEQTLLKLLETGGFQLLDVELSAGEDRVARLGKRAREQGIGTVVSRHDFRKTPPEKELYGTLKTMKALGADLPKLAVTPQSPEDVLALLSATTRASREIGPVITMAMGDLGKITRISGELFGSCLTFGAGRSASAPGQLDAVTLKTILREISPHGRG